MQNQIHIAELQSLAKQIARREETIEEFRRAIRIKEEEVAPEIILQGQDLAAARAKMAGSMFPQWLAVHCPGVKWLANLYIKRAQKAGNETMRVHRWVQQTLFHEQRTAVPRSERKRLSADVLILGKFEAAVFAERHYPVEGWSDECKARLVEVLGPIVRRLWADKFNG